MVCLKKHYTERSIKRLKTRCHMKRQTKVDKVALYARVSTKDGRQDTENQLIALREYCVR